MSELDELGELVLCPQVLETRIFENGFKESLDICWFHSSLYMSMRGWSRVKHCRTKFDCLRKTFNLGIKEELKMSIVVRPTVKKNKRSKNFQWTFGGIRLKKKKERLKRLSCLLRIQRFGGQRNAKLNKENLLEKQFMSLIILWIVFPSWSFNGNGSWSWWWSQFQRLKWSFSIRKQGQQLGWSEFSVVRWINSCYLSIHAEQEEQSLWLGLDVDADVFALCR